MPERSTAGEVVAAFLERCNVDTVFGVISIHNMPILDAISRRNRIRFVMSRGEAGAANMADAHARVFQAGGLLRRKLVLMLAILESSGDTESRVDSVTAESRLGFLVGMGFRMAGFATLLILGTLVFLPLKALAVLETVGGRR